MTVELQKQLDKNIYQKSCKKPKQKNSINVQKGVEEVSIKQLFKNINPYAKKYFNKKEKNLILNNVELQMKNNKSF